MENYISEDKIREASHAGSWYTDDCKYNYIYYILCKK